jgi:hypothetical protein
MYICVYIYIYIYIYICVCICTHLITSGAIVEWVKVVCGNQEAMSSNPIVKPLQRFKLVQICMGKVTAIHIMLMAIVQSASGKNPHSSEQNNATSMYPGKWTLLLKQCGAHC